MSRTFQEVEFSAGPFSIGWEEAQKNPALEGLLLDYMYDQLVGLMDHEETIERNPTHRSTEYCVFGQTWKEIE